MHMQFIHTTCTCSAPSSLFQKVTFWRPLIVKWSPWEKIQSPKRKKTWRGGHFMTYYTSPNKGEDTSWHSTRMANAPNSSFSTLYFCYSKFTHSCRVSEQRVVKREIQVMPPLVLLIKFVLLLIIFPASFSFNLLVANWRLSPEFWSPNIFSTRRGDQNGRSLERCKMRCLKICSITLFDLLNPNQKEKMKK